MLEGKRGEESIAELCRKEGIPSNLYYRWSNEFFESRKKLGRGHETRSHIVFRSTQLPTQYAEDTEIIPNAPKSLNMDASCQNQLHTARRPSHPLQKRRRLYTVVRYHFSLQSVGAEYGSG